MEKILFVNNDHKFKLSIYVATNSFFTLPAFLNFIEEISHRPICHCQQKIIKEN